MKSTEKNKKQKQVNQNKGRRALEKWAPMLENYMNRKESKKKPKREAWKKTKTKCKWIYLLQPTKILWKHGKPKDKRRSNGGKKKEEEDCTDGVATNGQRVMPRLESKRKQKMKS